MRVPVYSSHANGEAAILKASDPGHDIIFANIRLYLATSELAKWDEDSPSQNEVHATERVLVLAS